MTSKPNAIVVPQGAERLLLHACCAPCSGAIVEWMLANGLRPTIFYFNPNIFPRSEYDIRKEESKRHAAMLGLPFVDGDYDHDRWLALMSGLEDEPERGLRCHRCFEMRLRAAALCARELGLSVFATTLASSRWKNLEQVNDAGRCAAQAVEGTVFWEQNWRRHGLSDRRSQLIRQYGFYNQTYCGCEFSLAAAQAHAHHL